MKKSNMDHDLRDDDAVKSILIVASWLCIGLLFIPFALILVLCIFGTYIGERFVRVVA